MVKGYLADCAGKVFPSRLESLSRVAECANHVGKCISHDVGCGNHDVGCSFSPHSAKKSSAPAQVSCAGAEDVQGSCCSGYPMLRCSSP